MPTWSDAAPQDESHHAEPPENRSTMTAYQKLVQSPSATPHASSDPTGVAEATDTSTGSFVSFRIYEQVKCITAPGENALWFMYEPVLMSKKAFNKLDKKQQGVLIAAGKKSQAYFAKEAKGLDDEMVKVFKEHKVEVVTLTSAEYDQWVKVARESSYAEFATEVPDGQKLIDAALGVK